VRDRPLVLFDLDDTLFDHRRAARRAVCCWLVALGVTPSDCLVNRWFALEALRLAAWQRGELDLQGLRRNHVRDMLAVLEREVHDDRELDRLFDGYLHDYRAGWRAFTDVWPTLQRLHDQGVQVAVLTNGVERLQLEKLLRTGLAGRVGPVFCADAIGFRKPDRSAFLHACGKLGRDPPSVISVGDRYDLDVIAARTAGLRAIHLDREGAGGGNEPSRIRTLHELIDCL
jgi:putative hydrolase of the HAD superfamily